jgi:cell division protein FtsZ
MIHFELPKERPNIIKVLGFGGGGGNAVNHMYSQHIQNVDFIICNTDAQALQHSPVPHKIQLGPHLTQGLGAGADPEVGKQATEESLEEIRRILEVGTKMAFITAGMGGGTGTGGAPTVARICREMGILTVGIVTTPFQFEGPRRMAQARLGIEELKQHVDTLLVISNDKLRSQFGNLKMKEAFAKADDVLTTAARCITDVINTTGQINVDFADVCTVMRNGGVAILGSATASGGGRALKAIEAAINSPLLNDNDITGAKWILLNISSAEGDHEYTMEEVELIQDYVRRKSGENTDVILGMGYDSDLGDSLGITIIATGFRHKDPFDKNISRKPEVIEEPRIFMTLGVAGEEVKMMDAENEKTPATEPEVNPEFEEVYELRMENEQSVTSETQTEPAESLQSEEEEVPTLAEKALGVPLTFDWELKLEKEGSDINTDEELEETSEMDVPVFLNKPARIYNEIKSEATATAEASPGGAERETAPNPEDLLAQPMVAPKPWSEEEEAVAGITLSFETPVPAPTQAEPVAVQEYQVNMQADNQEEEEQKRRAKERINRLRNLSFNAQNLDGNSEFEQVPAYLRRDLNLHNSIANVEDFYSRAQVKTDENNQTSISTLNNFLHGHKPD